jgi:hypothetical protein
MRAGGVHATMRAQGCLSSRQVTQTASTESHAAHYHHPGTSTEPRQHRCYCAGDAQYGTGSPGAGGSRTFPHPEARMMACHAEHLCTRRWCMTPWRRRGTVSLAGGDIGASSGVSSPALTPHELAHKLHRHYVCSIARRYSLWPGGYWAHDCGAGPL